MGGFGSRRRRGEGRGIMGRRCCGRGNVGGIWSRMSVLVLGC